MMEDLKKYINFKNPLFRFFLFLSFFSFVATADVIVPTVSSAEKIKYFMTFLVTITGGAAVYYIVRYGFRQTMSNPANFFVSVWIIYLLIHPTSSIWYFVTAVAAVAIGKYIGRRNNLPIFNPAAFGLFLTYVVTYAASLFVPSVEPLLISWWGADMFQNITSNIPLLNIAVPLVFLFSFVYFANAFRKVPYSGTFFGVFLALTFIYSAITGSFDQAVNVTGAMVFNATAFCAFVMLAEPKTSPVFLKEHIGIGVAAAVTLFIFNNILPSWPIDPLLNTVLIANVFVLLSKWMRERRVATPQT